MNPTQLIAPVRFDRKKLQRPDREVLQLVAKMKMKMKAKAKAKRKPSRHARSENRTALRHAIGAAFPVMPADDAGQATGEEFLAVVSDISTSGIALLHSCPIEDGFFIVELEMEGFGPVQLLVEIMREERVQRFFMIAGRFVGRADEAKTDAGA